ncbi:MAG: extracellular solute-binding protein [Anaerolineales bacterium]
MNANPTLPVTVTETVTEKGGSVPATPDPTQMSEAMGLELSELDGITVTFWHVWGSDELLEGITNVILAFDATNAYGITVKALNQGGYNGLEDAMNAAIQSGDVPDLVVGNANAFASWYAVDAIIDMAPYMEDEVVGLGEGAMGDFFEGPFESGVTSGGERISLPFQQSANVLFYNETWAQELGFDSPPSNVAEFKEQACAAAEANNTDDSPDNDGTGGLVIYTEASNVMSWVFAYGGDVYDEQEMSYDFTSEEVVGVAEFWKSLWDEGCAFEMERYPYPDLSSPLAFSTREALFIMSSTAGLSRQMEAFETEGATDDEWTLIPFVGPEGEKAVNVFVPSLAVVKTTAKKQLAAWLFITYLLSPETQAEWATFSDTYPVRMSAGEILKDDGAGSPQWKRGFSLLSYGKTEPPVPSWPLVRRAVGDAFADLFRKPSENIPAILESLEDLADELVSLNQ